MSQSSRRWLVGSLLSAVLVGGGLFLRSLHGQTPGGGQPPRAAPPGAAPPGAAREAVSPAASQEGLLRFSRNVPGDAKPILIDADEVSTWSEGGRVALLLRGRVLVQQSVVTARFAQGIAWIDQAQRQSTGILRVELYAEGGADRVRIETAGEGREGAAASVELHTRGELKLRVGRGKVKRQDGSRDPVVLRARQQGLGPQAAPRPAPKAAPAPGVLPPPGETPGALRPPPGALPGQSLPPISNLPAPGAARRGPGPSAGLIQAQAIEPGPPPVQEPTSPPSPAPGQPSRIKSEGPPPVPFPLPPDSERPPARPKAKEAPPPQPPRREASKRPVPALPVQRTPATPDSPPAIEYNLLPRSGQRYDLQFLPDRPDGRRVVVATGGLIINVRNVPRIGVLDIEADRAVVWSKSANAGGVVPDLGASQGGSSSELELYLAGHVVLRARQPNGREDVIIEADELYYDVNRHVAIALQSRLQLMTTRLAQRGHLTDPVIVTTPELVRVGLDTYEVREAEIYSSKLPSDPGLKLIVGQATVTNTSRPRTDIFGRQVFDRQGRPLDLQESILEARSIVGELEGVPFFYLPYLVADARDPLGPLESIHLGANRVFGFQAGVGLNVWKLLGMLPPEGTRWRLNFDYLSRRGPAVGTTFEYSGKLWSEVPRDPFDPFAPNPRYEGVVRAFGIYDNGTDILGGERPNLTFNPPGGRGRALWRQGLFDLPAPWGLPGRVDVLSQVSLLSDRNFLEQYYKREFDTEPNQATFVYGKLQDDNWAVSGLFEPRVRNWVTETQWLPRLDGYWIGQSFFDALTYNAHASVAYAQLSVTSDPPGGLFGPLPPPPGYPLYVSPTDQRTNTGRFSLMQELAAPFDAGPVKLVPYAKLLLAEYTSDLAGETSGRAWGGGGLRASMPLTRLYPDACSELFNVRGLNHKMVLSGNYFYARANEPYTRYPQLDRLNDDATDQALRDLRPRLPLFYPGTGGYTLATSRLYDPQAFAIRRLVDNRLDTLEEIHALQVDLRQRLQTKRGVPGSEHIIDWMVLDTSFTYFPQDERDNFGKPFSFLEYQYLWNLGDRTALESSGWYDPIENGPKVFTAGLHLNRPDRTSFFLGYRQIDPLKSRVVIGSVNYLFSPKYAMTFTTAYDFGNQAALTNSLLFTRIGTDLQVSLGFTYNSLQKNFGAIVEIVPNLVPLNRRGAGLQGMSGLASR